MARSVVTVTDIGWCILGSKWSQGSNPQGVAIIFFSFIFSSIPLLLICILENENIGIVSISFIVIHTWVHFKSSTPYSAYYMSWRLHYLWRPLHMSKCTQKHYVTKEIVSNTLIGLLIRDHKFRTRSETFMNPVKLFNVFLQVKINTFLTIHEKKRFSALPISWTILIFCVFPLTHSFLY